MSLTRDVSHKMPTDAVWVVVTIPKKEREKELDEKFNKISKYNGYLDVKTNVSNIQTEVYLEKLLEDSLSELGIKNGVWISSRNEKHFHVYFPVDLYSNDATLNYLQTKGIGVKKESSVGYIPFGLYFTNESEEDDFDEDDDVFADPLSLEKKGHKVEIGSQKMKGFKKIQDEFLKSVTSRLTVAQVVQGVRSSAELTFDFVMYAIFSGCIAAAGLMNNSAVDVAAAMMIEPVMATVIAITFGLVIQDRSLTMIGVRSCIISLIICLAVGYIYGIIVFFWADAWNPPPNGIWPTPEMAVRGEWRTLWYGALQALAAGGAISVTLLNDNQAALVGVAVASTFLPPFINTGLLWAYTTHITVRGHSQDLEAYTYEGQTYMLKKAWQPMKGYEVIHNVDMRWEFMALSGVSMIYTLVNIVCMLAMGYVLLRAKEVVPLGSFEPNKRFFKEDIKVARDYNRRMTLLPPGTTNAEETIGNQILSEWAEIAGLDPGTLLSEKPEAEVTRRQTLLDIIGDVTADSTYQSVTKSALGGQGPSDTFLRRVTMGNIYGNGRKKSLANIKMAGSTVPSVVFDVEGNSQTVGAGNYKKYKMAQAKRRGSKWLPGGHITETPSPNLSISSNNNSIAESVGVRGLRPEELENRSSVRSRKHSIMLRKSLKESEKSPFSVWPRVAKTPSLSSSATAGTNMTEMRRRSTVASQRGQGRQVTFSESEEGQTNRGFQA